MTPAQIHMINALKAVTFPVGSSHKRFAHDLGAKGPAAELTIRQDDYLRSIVHRYRRQISPAIVALAKDAGA